MLPILDSMWNSLTGPWSTFEGVDIFAATVNAFNAALLVRRPTHYRHYTIIGVILLAILGGIMGGVSRDVLLNTIPSPLENPWYIILSIIAGAIALAAEYRRSMRFREGLFAVFTAFSLPWFVVVGVNKSLDFGLPIIDALAIGVVASTAGRFLIDLIAGLTPKHFVRGEYFVLTMVLTGVVYVILYEYGVPLVPASLISVAVGFTFRMLALYFGWEEAEPWEPPELKAGEAPRKSWKQHLEEEREASRQATP